MLSIYLFIITLTTIALAAIPPQNRQLKEGEIEFIRDKPRTPIKIQRPVHLDGVPLERDGGLNFDFRKEVLLGEDKVKKNKDQSIDKKDDEKNQVKKLIKNMFKQADRNYDKMLDFDELKNQIIFNTKKHLDDSKKESNLLFQTIDENGDGKITWPEYKTNFLREKKLSENENLDEVKNLLEDELEVFKNADGDSNDSNGEDARLDEYEWLAFRHPELSNSTLEQMADNILISFDKNQDNKLSVEEFVSLTADNDAVVSDPEMERKYREKRRNEFLTTIDLNGDKWVIKKELLEYVNPYNEHHAKSEAEEIILLADSNKDKKVDETEMLAKSDLLLSSGFIQPEARLHDDL